MAASDIKISLIRSNPPGPDKVRGKWVNLNEEYVEIENSSNEDANISGWILADVYDFKDMRRRHEFVFPKGTKVNANSILKIMTGNGKNDFETQKFYWTWQSAIWNNQGDVAVLYDQNLQIVDFQGIDSKIFGTVEGFVKDAETGDGVKDADVSGETGLMPAKTNGRGKYILRLIAAPNGVDRKATASKEDKYASQTQSVTVYPNKISNLDFSLDKGGGGAFAIDLSIIDQKLIVNNVVSGQIQPIEFGTDRTWKVHWGTDYDIKIIYQNNKSPITAFQSYIYESQDKNSFPVGSVSEFGLPERKGSFVDNEIAAVYNIPEKDWGNWKWVRFTDWTEGWYAKKNDTRRRYYYKLKYYGKRGNFPPNAEQTAKEEILPRNVLIYVSDEKLEAFDLYNWEISKGWIGVALVVAGIASGVGAVLIGTGVVVVTVSAKLIESMLAVLGLGAEGVALGLKLSTEEAKETFRLVMEDPPKFVKNYKLVNEPFVLKSHKNAANITHALSTNIKALVETNNKMYSCAVRSDEILIRKHQLARVNIKKHFERQINALDNIYAKNKTKFRNVRFDKNKLFLAIDKIKTDANLKKKLGAQGFSYKEVLTLDKLLRKNVINLNKLRLAKLIPNIIKSLRKLHASL